MSTEPEFPYTLGKLQAEVDKLKNQLNRTCEWKLVEDYGYWEGQCGSTFCDEADVGLDSNEYKYCPKCGGKIKEVK